MILFFKLIFSLSEQVFTQMDKNGDGKIDFEEFSIQINADLHKKKKQAGELEIFLQDAFNKASEQDRIYQKLIKDDGLQSQARSLMNRSPLKIDKMQLEHFGNFSKGKCKKNQFNFFTFLTSIIIIFFLHQKIKV